MKNKLRLIFPFIAGIFLASCHTDEKEPTLRIGISDGPEVGSVRVLLTLDAPEKEGYTVNYTFYSYDLPTGSRLPLINRVMLPAEEEPSGNTGGEELLRRIENVSFPGGRKAFIARGFDNGTYQVEISVTRDDVSLSAYSVFVLTPEGVSTEEGNGNNGNGGNENENGNGNENNGNGNENGNGNGNEGSKPAVTDFTLPGIDAEYGSFCLKMGEPQTITPEFSPSDAEPDWKAACSNPDVATATVSGGAITVTPLKPGRTSLSVSCGEVVKTLPLLVYQNVTVKVSFHEDEATDVQVATKTFPCSIRFESDALAAFDSPIVFTVSMKAVVTRTNHDVQEVTDKTNISFYGNRVIYYNIDEKILLPAWDKAGRTKDFNLALSLSIQRSNPLDPAIWRISYDDAYKTQDARIAQYITSGLQ